MDLKKFRISRTLTIARQGVTRNVKVSIGGIEEIEHEMYACHYALPGILPKNGRIYGSDPIQAVELCLRTVGQVISASVANGSVEIWWHEKGDNGGFLSTMKTRRRRHSKKRGGGAGRGEA